MIEREMLDPPPQPAVQAAFLFQKLYNYFIHFHFMVGSSEMRQLEANIDNYKLI